MKRILGVVILSLGLGSAAFAQTTATGLDNLGPAFKTFAGDVANSLPFASTMGLNWSWAYIGNLPHFGVGLAAGAAFLPTTGFNEIANTLGISGLPAPFNNPALGIPLPAYVAEARIGGIILPFDLGVKVGFIPKQYAGQLSNLLGGAKVNFNLFGGQLRYDLVKEKILRPAVSVGFAVNYFEGQIALPVPGVSAVNFPTYTNPLTNNSYTVKMSQPIVNFGWKSTSLDASVEVSKKILLIITPYIGAGLTYGISSAGGGVSSTLSINGVTEASNPTLFNTYLNDLKTALALAGQSQTFSATNFSFNSPASGFSARAFGGVSVNLWFLKIDATGMYNVMTGKLGATIGARAQF